MELHENKTLNECQYRKCLTKFIFILTWWFLFQENYNLTCHMVVLLLLFQQLKYSVRACMHCTWCIHMSFISNFSFDSNHSKAMLLRRCIYTDFLFSFFFGSAFSTPLLCYLLQAAPEWLKNYLKSFSLWFLWIGARLYVDVEVIFRIIHIR